MGAFMRCIVYGGRNRRVRGRECVVVSIDGHEVVLMD